MGAPKPPDESTRLEALWRYRILDTASEQAFDALTELAAAICETPIALVSLVDERRQWFKSRVGLSVAETSRDYAFCAHAILADEVFTVNDASTDDRFADNPLVLQDPHIRFYAGMPLTVGGGQQLGTLCVIDREPRTLTPAQLHALETLRGAVVAQLELRRALQDLSDVRRLLPMCAWCRMIRTDDGAWMPLHRFVEQATPVTHGMCPTCMGQFGETVSGGDG